MSRSCSPDMARIRGFSLLGHGRAVRPPQAVVARNPADGLVPLDQTVQITGGRVEHGDATFGVAGDDAFLQRVQQNLEKPLLTVELGRRLSGGR